jgi:hypothetical protein
MASTHRDVQEEEEDEDRRISWYGKDKATNQARTGGWDADAENADAEVVLSPDSVVTNVQSHKPFTRHTEEQLRLRR